MKKLLIASFLFLSTICVYSQLVVNSVTITPSTCYNDGTLTLNVSGGTAPYQYTIISGPVLQNVTYPILPDNGSSFVSLHWGTYVVQITDNAGNTISYNATIPGSYQFPVITTTVTLNKITATPSLGLPPYLYSLSTVGPNGPFGRYRSNGVFDSLCNGVYYVRVQDSCGNFYTTSNIIINQPPLTGFAGCFSSGGVDNVSVYTSNSGNPPYTFILKNGSYTATNHTGTFAVPAPYTCPSTVYILDFCNDTFVTQVDCHPLTTTFCSNFSDSSAQLNVTGGQGPYTYHYYTQNPTTDSFNIAITQDSGHFVHLPYINRDSSEVRFDVTDACGRTASFSDKYLNFNTSTNCPFDGKVYVNGLTGNIGTTTATCVSCSPQQTISVPSGNFVNLDTGSYTIRVTDGCGETRELIKHIPDNQPITAAVRFTACNDVVVTAASSNGDPITTGVTFTLFIGTDSITQDTTGLFLNLLQGAYTVRVQPDLCLGTSINFYVPSFAGYCYTPFFDTTCQLRLIVQYGPNDLPEKYSLISGGNVYPETPPGPNNGIYFNVLPGSYQLVSDSGCAINQNFNFNFGMTETHSSTCLNIGNDTLRISNPNYFTCQNPLKLRYTLQSSDTVYTIISNYSPEVIFANLPADTFVARVYLNDDTVRFGNSLIPNGNRTCPLDSEVVIIPKHVVPFLTSANVTVCGSTDSADIPFTIRGGFAPYYITIPGYPGITTSSLSGFLPNIPLGSYTMIVSDSCGISSSLSISVIDSCISCDTVFADFTVSDTNLCVGQTVSFHNLHSTGVSYQWKQNGSIFSNSPNASLTVTTAGDKIIECVINQFLCHDTFTAVIHVSETPQFNLGNDTLICDNFTRRLSSGVSTTHWSTGAIDSFIIVSSPGLYWASINGACGTFSDSVRISQSFTPVIELGHDSVLCNGDSLVLYAHSDSATYLWSNGSTNDSIVVNTAGKYWVSASFGGCVAFDSITFQTADIGKNLLPEDTILCIGKTIVLTPKAGTNPVWQDGSHTAFYTVSDSGIYIVTVNSLCGDITDSIKVGFDLCVSKIHIPDAFTPNGDGTNDHFTVFGTSIAAYEIRIFNRWGELVYESNDESELNDLSKGWDGTYKGKLQTTATFVYYITAKGEDDKSFTQKGNLTLIR